MLLHQPRLQSLVAFILAALLGDPFIHGLPDLEADVVRLWNPHGLPFAIHEAEHGHWGHSLGPLAREQSRQITAPRRSRTDFVGLSYIRVYTHA